MNLLEVKNLNSDDLLGGFALTDISFSIPAFKKVALIGQTGSGKSTLLKTIAGFVQHKSGSIYFNEQKIEGPNYQLIPGVKGIAYLSQHFELRHHYRMEELFAYANEHFTKEEAKHLFELCKVDHLGQRKSTELSGGEKQRVALVRLLLTKPQLLILDEPYSNLDLLHKNILKQVIEAVTKAYNITCLLCSHDAGDVLPWADEIVVMEQGQIIQTGTANEVYTNPENDYVAGLLGDYVNVTTLLKTIFKIENLNYLRPNNFAILPNGKITGIVKSCLYYGNYYRVEVEFEGELLVMNSIVVYENGEKIYFNLIETCK
ncbi:MAG: ABC transporter ATP-binding protein [Chitinophagaceae bacterium]|nr:ABC transporter ATP-binding protein [Chitinophagaceae bacterium]